MVSGMETSAGCGAAADTGVLPAQGSRTGESAMPSGVALAARVARPVATGMDLPPLLPLPPTSVSTHPLVEHTITVSGLLPPSSSSSSEVKVTDHLPFLAL